ncbi:MAG TPA: hypothetical protein VJU15_15945, partial [Gemmatimonadales bacterium]|nr:hypothetical protein [Gemmatimonadales bacterium]
MFVVLHFALSTLRLAQTPVQYEVAFPNRVHHEAEIAVTFSGVPPGPLAVRMSRSSPGRYAAHEFAKNVYSVKAVDAAGKALAVAKASPQEWTVSGHNGTVKVTYTLFADYADGTYAGIDRTHAHLNIPATFMWAVGFDARPMQVRFKDLPSGWIVATQLKPGADGATFSAPNLQFFMDSPIEVSALDLRSWIVNDGGKEKTIRLAIHHAGTKEEVDTYVDQIKKVVLEERAVYGELAPYDYGTYTFLADYLPYVFGDGMEHRNSTVLTSSRGLKTNARGNLGTVAHEFFHSWNVERIRPKGIEPFNFRDANMTGELWLAEGVTSYYGPLAMARAGITSFEDYVRGLSGNVNSVLFDAGRRYNSPREMSMMAPYVDAATSIDRPAFTNTFISYYTWGAALGLALDLTLRQRFPGVTMDDFMREMWRAHGKTERPYTNADARAVLGRVTRDTAFAGWFWRSYVDGREAPDYSALLAQAGVVVRQAAPDVAWVG